jgi:hypothetical protein
MILLSINVFFLVKFWDKFMDMSFENSIYILPIILINIVFGFSKYFMEFSFGSISEKIT